MKVKIDHLRKILVIVAISFSFSGSYVLILGLVNLGLGDESRRLTIPLRIITIVSFSILFYLYRRKKRSSITDFFLIFSILYLFRILLEYLKGGNSFHIPIEEFLLYFGTFMFLPFVLISKVQISSKDLQLIFWSIIIGQLVLSVQSIWYYKDIIGNISRMSSAFTDEAINPLILAYNSVLGILMSIFYMIQNKTTKFQRFILFFVIGISMVPLFLGGSRGSLIAIISSILFYFIYSKGFKQKTRIILTSIFFVSILLSLSPFLGEGLINRFTSILDAINSGDYSNVRFQLWFSSWYQFLENPIIGNSLENDFYNRYPHNIVMEVLISTGIIGLFIFLVFLYLVFKKSIWILRNSPQHYFLVIILLVSVSKALFSGGLYSHNWLAISSALIASFQIPNQEEL